MDRITGLALTLGLLLDGQPQPASKSARLLELPGKKLALVMGNNAYPQMPLTNAVNDAKALAGALGKIGFQVDQALDCDLRSMEKAADRFIASIEGGDIALFFYAGHGIQVAGDNYLVPVNFKAKDEADAKYEAYSVSRIQERMEGAGSRVNIVILDACRNNPFRASRSAASGLAAMNTSRGTFIAFATAPGRTASDNPKGGNGLFTGYLVEEMARPGLTLDQLFNRVRERVYKSSSEKQLPWTGSSVIGDYYLHLAAGEPAAQQEARLPEPAPAPVTDPVSTAATPSQAPQPADTAEVRQRMDLMVARVSAVLSGLKALEANNRASGVNLRGDMVASRTRMEQALDRAESQLKQNQPEAASKSLHTAERDLEKLEKFLRL